MNLRAAKTLVRLRIAAVVLLLLGAFGFEARAVSDADPEYVGIESCQACHEIEVGLWRGSHHDLAMQHASDATVLGDFDDARFDHAGVTSKFFKRGARFIVNTDGPDGKLSDFEIRYTFGVAPLQQYLVELPGGRLQVLTIAWDTRPAGQGGQRWFHLYPDEAAVAGDELHWTHLNHNWNSTCAECHSTHLDKNYDPASRSYATTWSDIDVSCEACHGPGSNHVAWASETSDSPRSETPYKGLTHRLDERSGVAWQADPETGTPRRSVAPGTRIEIETCAACHSRRAQLFEDDRTGQPLMDAHLPSLLEAGNYHVDGQIDGEVYVYGSFLQSRMYQAGVSCSDCHEPHSLQLRAPGNGVCLQCHAAADYDDSKHHFHAAGGAGSQCVDCHMPAKNYMVVDPRRDHSFRVPRPDLSARFGTPDACTGCHADRKPAWATDRLREWYGETPRGLQNYAAALHAARAGSGNVGAELAALLGDASQPAIARASAAQALQSRLDPDAVRALIGVIDAADPLLRQAAAQGLRALPAEYRWQVLQPLLGDPVRAVRIAAGELLADIPPERLPAADAQRLRAAIDEYLAAQTFNAEYASAQVNVGNLHTAQRRYDRAEEAYRLALELDPGWVPAYVNLADLFRLTGRDAQGISLLRSGLERRPRSADLYHSLGLAQVRAQALPQALESLREAAALAPDNPRYAYVYAVALHSADRTDEALAYIDDALARFPDETTLYQLREQLSGAP